MPDPEYGPFYKEEGITIFDNDLTFLSDLKDSSNRSSTSDTTALLTELIAEIDLEFMGGSNKSNVAATARQTNLPPITSRGSRQGRKKPNRLISGYNHYLVTPRPSRHTFTAPSVRYAPTPALKMDAKTTFALVGPPVSKPRSRDCSAAANIPLPPWPKISGSGRLNSKSSKPSNASDFPTKGDVVNCADTAKSEPRSLVDVTESRSDPGLMKSMRLSELYSLAKVLSNECEENSLPIVRNSSFETPPFEEEENEVSISFEQTKSMQLTFPHLEASIMQEIRPIETCRIKRHNTKVQVSLAERLEYSQSSVVADTLSSTSICSLRISPDWQEHKLPASPDTHQSWFMRSRAARWLHLVRLRVLRLFRRNRNHERFNEQIRR